MASPYFLVSRSRIMVSRMKFDGVGAGSGNGFFPASAGGLVGLMSFIFYTWERIYSCQTLFQRVLLESIYAGS